MLNWMSTNKRSSFSSVDIRASAPFYVADGTVLWTIRDLGDALLRVSDETFAHHVYSGKNDFSNWLEGCFPPKVAAVGAPLRNCSRDDAIKLLVAFQQGKKVPEPTHYPASGARLGVESLPLINAEEHRPALILPQPKSTLAQPTFTPENAGAKQPGHIDLHPKPLPESPLKISQDHRLKQIRDELGGLRAKATVDSIAAKEEFISVRTRVWRDLTEDERKQILPHLREVYDFLVQTH